MESGRTGALSYASGSLTHVNEIEYLYLLIQQWELRAAGEPHTLTPAMLEQWSMHRQSVAECRRMIHGYSLMDNAPVKLPFKTARHAAELQTVGAIIARLQIEYEWPKPSKPLVTSLDIQRLRECITSLEQCRISYNIMY